MLLYIVELDSNVKKVYLQTSKLFKCEESLPTN